MATNINIRIPATQIDGVVAATSGLVKADDRQWVAYVSVRQTLIKYLDEVPAKDLAVEAVEQIEKRAVSKGQKALVDAGRFVRPGSLQSYWSEVNKVEKSLDVRADVKNGTVIFTGKDRTFTVVNRSQMQGLGILLAAGTKRAEHKRDGRIFTLNNDGTVDVQAPKKQPQQPQQPQQGQQGQQPTESAEQTLDRKLQEGITLLNSGIKGVDGKYRPLTEKQTQQLIGLVNNGLGAVEFQASDDKPLSDTTLKHVIRAYKKIARLPQIKALAKN